MNLYRWNLERWLDWRFRVGDARLDILDRLELTYDDSRLTRNFLWKFPRKLEKLISGNTIGRISFIGIETRPKGRSSIRIYNSIDFLKGYFSFEKHDLVHFVKISFEKKFKTLAKLPLETNRVGFFDCDRIELIVGSRSIFSTQPPPQWHMIINDNIFGFIGGTALERKEMENCTRRSKCMQMW